MLTFNLQSAHSWWLKNLFFMVLPIVWTLGKNVIIQINIQKLDNELTTKEVNNELVTEGLPKPWPPPLGIYLINNFFCSKMKYNTNIIYQWKKGKWKHVLQKFLLNMMNKVFTSTFLWAVLLKCPILLHRCSCLIQIWLKQMAQEGSNYCINVAGKVTTQSLSCTILKLESTMERRKT